MTFWYFINLGIGNFFKHDGKCFCTDSSKVTPSFRMSMKIKHLPFMSSVYISCKYCDSLKELFLFSLIKRLLFYFLVGLISHLFCLDQYPFGLNALFFLYWVQIVRHLELKPRRRGVAKTL